MVNSQGVRSSNGQIIISWNVQGCISPTRTSVSVGVSPVPTPSASSNSPQCAGATLNLTSGGGISYAWSGPNGFTSTEQNPTINNITSANAGTYTVTVTNGINCSATATTNVVVNASPSITAVSDSPTCIGNTVNLYSTGASSFAWTGPEGFTSSNQNPSIINANPIVTGIYTVTGSSAFGCIGSATTSVTVNQIPDAPTNATATPSTICLGGSTNLSATATGNNINWWTAATGGTQLSQVASGANYSVSPVTTTTYYAETYTGVATNTYSFTNASASGRLGPNLSAITSAYAATNLAGQVSIGSNQGIQIWTVPFTGNYTFQVNGASGGTATNAGKGARVTGTVFLTSGTQLNLLVGQMGSSYVSSSYSNGGGGGSFVANGGTLLFAAGGGGGSAQSPVSGQDASTTNSVISGSAAQLGSAGAGYSTNGVHFTYGAYTTVAQSFTNGGNGQAGGTAGGWPGGTYGEEIGRAHV